MHFGRDDVNYLSENDDGTFDDVTGRLKKVVPKDTQDRLAMFVLFVLLPTGFLYEIFGILPLEHPILTNGWIVRVTTLTLLGLNAFANAYKVIKIGPNGDGPELPAVLKPGYRFCHSCQLNEPPRSHHCAVCNKCALRRDHHCSFLAICIGHFNQRYYVGGVCNFWIIAAVISMWNWSLMWSSLGGFSPLQLWELLVPHIALLLRVISFTQFLKVMNFVFAFTVFVFLSYLLVAQLFCFHRGQTRVEYLMDIHAYKLSFTENLRQALGERWPLFILFPLVSSRLPSDGLSFETIDRRSIAENIKNM